MVKSGIAIKILVFRFSLRGETGRSADDGAPQDPTRPDGCAKAHPRPRVWDGGHIGDEGGAWQVRPARDRRRSGVRSSGRERRVRPIGSVRFDRSGICAPPLGWCVPPGYRGSAGFPSGLSLGDRSAVRALARGCRGPLPGAPPGGQDGRPSRAQLEGADGRSPVRSRRVPWPGRSILPVRSARGRRDRTRPSAPPPASRRRSGRSDGSRAR